MQTVSKDDASSMITTSCFIKTAPATKSIIAARLVLLYIYYYTKKYPRIYFRT